MAVVTVSISELIERTGLDKDRIIDGLNEIGAPVDGEKEGELFVEVTPNRPDFYSVEGLARALNYYHGKEPAAYAVGKSDFKISVDPSVAKVRPYIVSALVKNVRMDDATIKSLIQLQEKLHDTIGRKRKKIAIGIHNADAVKPPLVYRAVADERFVPLDYDKEMDVRQILSEHPKGKDYCHLVGKLCPMLYDQAGVVSFPPIINGERTRVGEKTTSLFIDITGTHKKTIEGALNIICCALADRGGKVLHVNVGGEASPNLKYRQMKLDFEAIARLLGEKMDRKQILDGLQRLGWMKKGNDAMVAPYRMDVSHFSDAAEDAAIAHGYNDFKPTTPKFFTPGRLANNHQETRKAMVGLGFIEVVNNALTNKADVGGKKALGIINPKTEEFTVLRMRIADSLLGNLVLNKTQELPIRLFEIGQVYEKCERTDLGFVISAESLDFSDLRGALQGLFEYLDVSFSLKKAETPLFIKGRCASIVVDGVERGFIGEVKPEKLEELGVENPVGLCEMNLG